MALLQNISAARTNWDTGEGGRNVKPDSEEFFMGGREGEGGDNCIWVGCIVDDRFHWLGTSCKQ